MSRTDEISVPTLVIHGTDDPIIPYEHGVHLSKIISNAVLITLDGAGDELHYND
ncbi:pimeloyl-ACP methyl ester carboxylesterase [Clostridium beijerinckii]|nr:alpha/beta hydrolase [Clostridium beijerinckii]MBA8937489.1 pimeloyl-ACP methyl ester carboxylesterase [Clostridium beijerinckii]NRU41418.1 pimeloyl-ACP methyl ester carboxylesterase [Clostridium beijerinckii]NSA95306.1 pimeloyl-ACP methyl ester carboxylesterase [Clostridium beijerinckii]OOM65292.1 alpha/beta hydrolase fold protein [Clostridium beijerinckii]OOM71212.1 alpha/beta hydrolase fold protein [Clostridium beijerinckii]